MERIKDTKPGADPILDEAASLLGAAPPYVPSPTRARRVRTAIAERRSARRVVWRVRPFAVAMTVLVIAGVAGAMVGGWRALRRRAIVPPPRTTPLHVPHAQSPAPRVEVVPPAIAPPAPSVETIPPRIAPRRTPPVAPAANVEAPIRDLPREGTPASATPVDRPPLEREMALLQAATRALRVDHEPERAGVLLDDYLGHHPDGALLEEALALAIEAAVARHDTHAIDLAARYLQRFPSGRFAPQARAATRRLREAESD